MSNREKEEVLRFFKRNMNKPISYPCGTVPDFDGDLIMHKKTIYAVNYNAGTVKKCGPAWLVTFCYFITHIKLLCKIRKNANKNKK